MLLETLLFLRVLIIVVLFAGLLWAVWAIVGHLWTRDDRRGAALVAFVGGVTMSGLAVFLAVA